MDIERKDNLFYNKKLQSNANALRNNMTKAEACLWKYVLRARSMMGYQFRRERPVLNYIADFMCKDLKLIIEVDGITHSFDGALEKDMRRQRELEEAGFRVIRFTDNEVLKGIDSVSERIREVILELEGRD
jgi:very-short-patch-repair endonuclease